MPTTPQNAAGCLMEPPVSVPRPQYAMPAAIDAAAPPDEPPGTRSLFHGLRVFLNAHDSVVEPSSNSSKFVLPTMGAPASFNFVTTVASYGGTQSSSTLLAAVVRTPSVQMLSLRLPGMPANGCSCSPRASASSTAFACSSACSAVTVK